MTFLPYLAGKALRRALEPGGHKLDPHRVPEHIQSIIADRNNKRLREAEIDPVDPDSKKIKQSNAIVPFTGEPTGGEQAQAMEGIKEGGGEETSGPLALRAGGQASQGAHETPVLPREPAYRFKETMTTVIPTTYYFSVNNLGFAASSLNKFEIRLNSPYSSIITPSSFVEQTAGAAVATGVSITQAPDGDSNFATLGSFPLTTTTNHKPQWLAYWEKIYEAYHVMETHYEITVMPARSEARTSVLVLWEEDQYGSSSTGNIMPSSTLDEMAEWVGTKQMIIRGTADDNAMNFGKIKSTWKPGRANRNTTNDGDVKTWNTTGAVPNPAYVESLHLRFFRGPLSSQNPASVIGCNVQVKISYIVQFKDLKQQFRYPLTGDSTVTLTLPTDVLKTA